MAVSTSIKAAKAPGTVTVGIDESNKHYRYVAGEGRGRKPTGITPQAKAKLAALGLNRKGQEMDLNPQVAASVFGAGGAKQPGAAPAGAAPKAAQSSKQLAAKILQSHAKWIGQTGKGRTSTAQRLRLLTANGRAEALSHAGSNPSEAHKALAASILGTIFAKGVRTGGAKGQSAFKVKFSPGGDGQEGYIRLEKHDGTRIAGITFKNLHSITAGHVEAIREHFQQAVKQPQPLIGTPEQVRNAPVEEPPDLQPNEAEIPDFKRDVVDKHEDKLVKQLEKLDAPKRKPQPANPKLIEQLYGDTKKSDSRHVMYLQKPRGQATGFSSGKIKFEHRAHQELYNIGSRLSRPEVVRDKKAGTRTRREVDPNDNNAKNAAAITGLPLDKAREHAKKVYEDVKSKAKGLKNDEVREIPYIPHPDERKGK